MSWRSRSTASGLRRYKEFTDYRDTAFAFICLLVRVWCGIPNPRSLERAFHMPVALRWEDIDWTHNLIRINKAVTFIGNQPHIKGPKSEKGNRNVPMLPQLAEILMPMNRQTGYVVSQDGEPFTDTMVKNSLHRIQVQADMQGHTFHSLRHSYATMLAKNPGIAPKTLQSLMGHADISTTFNMYAETENCTMAEAGCLFTQQLAQ